MYSCAYLYHWPWTETRQLVPPHTHKLVLDLIVQFASRNDLGLGQLSLLCLWTHTHKSRVTEKTDSSSVRNSLSPLNAIYPIRPSLPILFQRLCRSLFLATIFLCVFKYFLYNLIYVLTYLPFNIFVPLYDEKKPFCCCCCFIRQSTSIVDFFITSTYMYTTNVFALFYYFNHSFCIGRVCA